MNKQQICVIGSGGAGNKMLDVLMEIDGRYTPVYCNTNIREMENLEHFDAGNNALYFANAQGTGRDRNKAKEAIKKDQPKTIDFFANKFSPNSGINTFYILSSSDGGTGSGSVPMLATVIKHINPEATVNLLIAMCSLNEREASLRNTKALWNDIIKLMKSGKVNSVQFIDNNKMRDEQEFNEATMQEFDNSISVNNEEIDSVDSEKVNTAKGYKVILSLDPRYRDIDKAVKQAKEGSNFIVPDNLDCDFLMSTFDEDAFDKNSFKGKFNVYELDKYDYNDEGRNTIVLGGVVMPKDYIELIDMELDSLLEKKKDRNILSDDLMVEEEVAATSSPKKKAKTMTKKKLKELMNDDSFWD
ncbi:hypothetical protein [Clostridium sardiniense]|uniref:hypothetical protein n=1 Tax=Clostridium sardiniense TaxID=29369 RepID=UPI00195B4AA3|nr:hypothetical protein [Clostridium sardiniense]MBM7836296.1 hypothetical protein [Clostridium sardiniense]